MKIELNTAMVRVFSGAYGTLWDVNDFLEREAESMADTESPEDIDKLLERFDSKKYLRAIRDAYNDTIKDINDELKLVKIVKFTKPFSPREYNFQNDSLDFIAQIKKRDIIGYIIANKDKAEFRQFLEDNYSSRDGFISFTPDTPERLLEEIRINGDEYEQAISAVLRYANRHIIDCNLLDTVEYQVYENFTSNVYYYL